MPTQLVNGFEMHYRDQGQGTPLVLVHGFPLDSTIFDAQLAELSKECRVILPDLRGFGQSRSEAPFTLESLADDLHQLLHAIGALPCVLGGLSMGGYLSFAYLTKYPTDLRGLVLIDTRAEADNTEGKQNRDRMIGIVRERGSKVIADAMEPKMLSEDSRRNVELVQRLRRIMEACPPKTIEHALAAMRDRLDYRSELPSVAVPTQIIVGESDAITPVASAIAMNKEIPHSRLRVISGAGHLSPMECPQEFNQAVVHFLEVLRAHGRA